MSSGIFSRDSQTKKAEHLTVYCSYVCDYSKKNSRKEDGLSDNSPRSCY